MSSTLRSPSKPAPKFADEQEREAHLAARLESASLLAGGVAHDLNNILTAVLGFGTLLAEQVAADPDASSNAREVMAAAERAAALTQQLLAFSRRQLLSPARVDIGDIVQEMRIELQAALGSGIDLRLDSDGAVPPARVDAQRFKDALLVLLENAKDALPDGGHVTVGVETASLRGSGDAGPSGPAARYVRVSVSDIGTGMAADVQDRMFEPFYTTKPKGKGVGLGLSTVYGFVAQSGGFIRVRSEVGQGTTIALHLPVFDQAALAAPTPVPATPPRRRAAGETILLVEDTDNIRATTAEALRRAGYRVIAAASASEALHMAGLQRGPIQLLLTDVVMPGSSGFDLAKELRTERRGLRVLYMSGFTDIPAARGWNPGPGEAFLRKPFSSGDLLDEVGSLLT